MLTTNRKVQWKENEDNIVPTTTKVTAVKGVGEGRENHTIKLTDRSPMTRSGCSRKNTRAGRMANSLCHFLCHNDLSPASWDLRYLLCHGNPNEFSYQPVASMGVNYGMDNPKQP